MKLCSVPEMREMDRRAVSQFGIIEELLMENAGEAVYFSISEKMKIPGSRFIIICGTGNNGGDGLVIARKLHSMGGLVSIFLTGSKEKFQNAALLNFQICVQLGLDLHENADISVLSDQIQTADLVIDAIFGTGLEREATGTHKDIIDLLNGNDIKVVSVDIPSGISGDSGRILGSAVRADWTVTFGLPKTGNILYPGYEFGGELYITHISFPPEMTNDPQLMISTNDPLSLPVRGRNAHKGSCGKVLFIAGSAHYLGAPYFAAHTFLKAGGGLSFLATPDNAAPFIGNKGSEIILLPQKSTSSGSISFDNKSSLLENAAQCDLVVIGPGLSLDADTQKLAAELIREIDKPVLVDGDGLSALVSDLSILSKRSAPTVITPHPGEMARLLNIPVSEVEKNRLTLIADKAGEWKTIIVLKGAHTQIATPDGRIFINLSGNPGMATAGSGDVLCGIIAGMFGMDFDFESAVRMGVFVHGFSGDEAAKICGEDGLCATDIMEQVPLALKMLREKFSTVTENCYGKIYLI